MPKYFKPEGFRNPAFNPLVIIFPVTQKMTVRSPFVFVARLLIQHKIPEGWGIASREIASVVKVIRIGKANQLFAALTSQQKLKEVFGLSSRHACRPSLHKVAWELLRTTIP